MNLRFYPSVPEDAKVILQFNRQLIHRYEDIDAIDYDRVLNWVAKNIESNLPCFRRVFRDEKLVGYYGLLSSGKGTELDSFFVLPEFRNQGIGTEVLRHIQISAESPIFLYVFRRNTGAIALYRRMGFAIVKEVGSTRYVMEYQKQDC